MDDKTSLGNAADTVLNEPIKLEVDVAPTGKIHAFLQRIGARPKKRIFQMQSIYLGTLLRLSKLLLQIDIDILKQKTGMDIVHNMVQNDLTTIVKVVAIALHNKRTEVPKSLEDFVLHNFTAVELCNTVSLIITQMNVKDFINSIISIRGANILTNPNAGATNAAENEVSP